MSTGTRPQAGAPRPDSGFRIFESLRIDYSQYILGMRLNCWMATLVCLSALLWFAVIERGRTDSGPRPAGSQQSATLRAADERAEGQQ